MPEVLANKPAKNTQLLNAILFLSFLDLSSSAFFPLYECCSMQCNHTSLCLRRVVVASVDQAFACAGCQTAFNFPLCLGLLLFRRIGLLEVWSMGTVATRAAN